MKLDIDVSALLAQNSKEHQVSGSFDINSSDHELTNQLLKFEEGLSYDLNIEAQGEDIFVSGPLSAKWIGECRRCLEPVKGELSLEVREYFKEDFEEGENYPLVNVTIDLAPMLLEAVVLASPIAPLCSSECKGPVPEIFIDKESQIDSRWEALAEFEE